MDAQLIVKRIKAMPGFGEKVGMMLIHNGVVRASSRKLPGRVCQVDVTPDTAKIERICREAEKMPGIFRVEAEAASGSLVVGDDLLIIVVAGDFRENVIDCLTKTLNRMKDEAVSKVEHCQ